MIEALDRSAHDEGARAEAARKVAAWEAKSFHKDTGNRARPKASRALAAAAGSP